MVFNHIDHDETTETKNYYKTMTIIITVAMAIFLGAVWLAFNEPAPFIYTIGWFVCYWSFISVEWFYGLYPKSIGIAFVRIVGAILCSLTFAAGIIFSVSTLIFGYYASN